MRMLTCIFLFLLSCTDSSLQTFSNTIPPTSDSIIKDIAPYPVNSWQYFLQHLPVKEGPIVDYTGRKIADQAKHVAIINYDVGNKDLQQCADALMRLRAEYLFVQKRYSEIGFHFTSGHYYSWIDYCKGKRPVIRGNKVHLVNTIPSDQTHASLRKYLEIVYTYAGTISLSKELKPANALDIGTVVITPGSPGHCFIIVDKAKDKAGKPVYKLAEGYTPAQSIYILSNPYDAAISPWYQLTQGTIETSSYVFRNYFLRKFE